MLAIRGARVVPLLLCAAPLLRAQASATDTVTGVVYDSIAREPLAGAIVMARPRAAAAITDSVGRFDLVSAARVQSITVHHPSLDAMGLDGIGAVRPDAPGAWRDVRVATPSLATTWRLACGAQAPTPRPGRGVLVGSARLAAREEAADAVATPVLVSGARVQVLWERRTGADTTTSRSTITDARGTWALCDVPVDAELALAAFSREAQSGVVRLAADARPVRRVDLVLGRTGEQATGVVRGRVVDETGFPVAGARVTLDGADGDPMLTTRWGEFRIAEAPAGSRMLTAQAMGHAPVSQAVEIEARDGTPITLVLPTLPRLDRLREPPRVTVRDSVRTERAEFEARRRSGEGFVADSAAVQRAGSLGGVVRQVPWLRVRAVASSARAAGGLDLTGSRVDVRGADNCRVHVFLDGRATTLDRLQAVPVAQLAGVEAWPSRAQAPSRIASQLDGRECAVLLGWTARALRP